MRLPRRCTPVGPLAVQLAEQGRGVLWGRPLDTWDDLDKLSAMDRDLADALERVRAEMNG